MFPTSVNDLVSGFMISKTVIVITQIGQCCPRNQLKSSIVSCLLNCVQTQFAVLCLHCCHFDTALTVTAHRSIRQAAYARHLTLNHTDIAYPSDRSYNRISVRTDFTA